jgi:hypothetical protein
LGDQTIPFLGDQTIPLFGGSNGDKDKKAALFCLYIPFLGDQTIPLFGGSNHPPFWGSNGDKDKKAALFCLYIPETLFWGGSPFRGISQESENGGRKKHSFFLGRSPLKGGIFAFPLKPSSKTFVWNQKWSILFSSLLFIIKP